MYNYEIDDAIESVMDDMDEYDYYDYDDTDAFCDALESMVYDMADYLCYEQGYSEDEALEAANVYYGCALETSSQIKQVRNQARKTYNKAQKAAKRGDTYTANQLAAQAKNLDKKVRKAKDKVDAAVNVSHQQYQKRASQQLKQQSQKPGYTYDPSYYGKTSVTPTTGQARSTDKYHYRGGNAKYYVSSQSRDYRHGRRGSRGYQRQQNRQNSDYDVH